MLQIPATAVLVVINIVVFFLMAGDRSGDWPASFLVSWGGNLGTLTFNGEPWRLVTSMFLHGSLGHLGGNLICLIAWGSVTESALGTLRFVLAYFGFGVLASLASAWVNPDVVSVGASGAIAGILGLMVVIWLKGDARVGPRDLLANIALNAFMSFQPAVDGVAHLAGFVAGMGTGPLLFPASFVQRPEDRAEPTSELQGPIIRPPVPVSFQEPMNFPKGTIVYQARNRLVAVLPDWTLIADDRAQGAVFETARDYRNRMGDEGQWTLVRDFS